MRREGFSLRDIESKLKIPKSTLSGWFKNIKLNKKQKENLRKRWVDGLRKARTEAVKWHNKQKIDRLQTAEIEALEMLKNVPNSKDIIEIALSMLYLGEGFKKNSETGIGNSDPLILSFFVAVLKNIYKVKEEKITCYLHLRADQDQKEIKSYWSKNSNCRLKISEKLV